VCGSTNQDIALDTRIIKGIIALGALALSVSLFVRGKWVTGIFAVLLTAVLVLVVLRSMRMIIAFFYIRQQKVDKARTWLNRINPDHLWKNQKGYYYFLMGSVDIQTNSLAQSEKFFRTALQHGLRLDHDRAAVYLNLAVITANKRKKREAIHFLNEAKKFDGKGYLKNDIKQVSKLVNSI
jgi:tetratricopeptide (TPR) repeat protein